MMLPGKSNGAVKRVSESQIATAREGVRAAAERCGVTWDARRSRPASGDYWARCPFHQEKTASFHVIDRPGHAYFRCHGCGEKGDAIKLVRLLTGVGFREAVDILAGDLDFEPSPELIEAREQMRREVEAEAERQRVTRRAAAVALYYAAGVHIAGTIGETYLRRRAIAGRLGSAELRFHTQAPLSPYEPPKSTRRPAIVAPIRNAAGEHIGTHCTFLVADGSAKASLPHLPGSRLVVGEHVGAFIRLGRLAPAMVVAEGIETALSASEACGLPALACINAPNMRALVLPSTVQRLVIAFDRDAHGVGEMSAEVLAQRLSADGVAVEMFAPPEGFADWNDAARAGGLPRMEAA